MAIFETHRDKETGEYYVEVRNSIGLAECDKSARFLSLFKVSNESEA